MVPRAALVERNQPSFLRLCRPLLVVCLDPPRLHHGWQGALSLLNCRASISLLLMALRRVVLRLLFLPLASSLAGVMLWGLRQVWERRRVADRLYRPHR